MSENKKYIELQMQRKLLDLDIDIQKRLIHSEYMCEHKKLIHILDAMLVLALIFNLSALCLTNALVVKVEPAKTFHELNPVQCGLQGFNCSTVNNTAGVEVPNYSALLGFILHAFALGIIVASYWNIRRKIVSDKEFASLLIFAVIILVVCCFDFTNDAGYFLGKLLWGV
jgi:hypothetical protein